MECIIRLISDSSRKQKSSGNGEELLGNYDRVFSLPSDVESCRQYYDINPLRNRTVITEICSFPQVQKFLKNIVDFIDAKLAGKRVETLGDDKCEACVPGEVNVRVECSTGTLVSVCCVERLYHHYTLRPPAGLTVKREHRQGLPLAKRGNDKKSMVWQCTHLPYQNMEVLKDDRMWTSFSQKQNSLIETQFQMDPFSSCFELSVGRGGNLYRLNFDTGEVCSGRKINLLRCISIPNMAEKVKCSMLEEKAYKSMIRRFGAAGILFYAYHPITGEAVFLLGHMTYSSLSWSDFGGLKSYFERPRRTAARETFEETLGLLGSEDQLYELLGDYKTNNTFKVVNQNTDYVCHFVRIPYDNYQEQFIKKAVLETGALEMDEVNWFGLSSLNTAIDSMYPDNQVLTVHPTMMDGQHDGGQLCHLRSELAQTLCIAKELHILCSIQHICHQLHHHHHHHPQAHSSPSPDSSITNTSDVELEQASATTTRRCSGGCNHRNRSLLKFGIGGGKILSI